MLLLIYHPNIPFHFMKTCIQGNVTSLMVAAYHGSSEVVDVLLRAGANVNIATVVSLVLYSLLRVHKESEWNHIVTVTE